MRAPTERNQCQAKLDILIEGFLRADWAAYRDAVTWLRDFADQKNIDAGRVMCGGVWSTPQTIEAVRERAHTIVSVDSGTLTAKARDGGEMKIKLADNAPINEVVKAPLSDIKEGSYLAITASPQPDGSQKAMAIPIFPPSVHPPEGFSNWDLPNSTMTNATVASEAAGIDGQTLTVTYKDGEKKIIVPLSAEIVTYKKASVADLKPGQKIFVFAAKKLPDGMLEAPNISFGDYGVWR